MLHVRDAAPAEVLDRFLAGLAADVRHQVLVADPQDFERAVCWLNVWLVLAGRHHAVWVPMATAAASTCPWSWGRCMAPAPNVHGVAALVAAVAAGSSKVANVSATTASSRVTSC